MMRFGAAEDALKPPSGSRRHQFMANLQSLSTAASTVLATLGCGTAPDVTRLRSRNAKNTCDSKSARRKFSSTTALERTRAKSGQRPFTEMLSVRVFPDYVCRAVSVPTATSGAVLNMIAYDQVGDAVYFQDLFVPPNERRLVVTP